MDKMVSTLVLEGLVGPGQFLAAALSHDPQHRIYWLQIHTVNLQNCLKEAAFLSRLEPDGNTVARGNHQLDPIKVIETNLVDLASYMHYLSVYSDLAISDRAAVHTAYRALFAGASAIADARQQSAQLRDTIPLLLEFVASIGRDFALMSGFKQHEIDGLAVR
jgi:hypothetical protein